MSRQLFGREKIVAAEHYHFGVFSGLMAASILLIVKMAFFSDFGMSLYLSFYALIFVCTSLVYLGFALINKRELNRYE